MSQHRDRIDKTSRRRSDIPKRNIAFTTSARAQSRYNEAMHQYSQRSAPPAIKTLSKRNNQFLVSAHGLADRPNDEKGTWLGVKLLGAGGQGKAGLWVKHDAKGKILDRMVVKHSAVSERRWNTAEFWRGESCETGEPAEAYVHRLLSASAPEGLAFPRYFGHSVDWNHLSHRIYMANEYCRTMFYLLLTHTGILRRRQP